MSHPVDTSVFDRGIKEVTRETKNWLKILKLAEKKTNNKDNVKALRYMTNHIRLLKKEPMLTQILYLGILKNLIKKDFDFFITSEHQKDAFGVLIAQHNTRVLKDLRSAGVNVPAWLQYEISERENAPGEDSKANQWRWGDLEFYLAQLQNNFLGPGELHRSILKDIANIKKLKRAIQKGLLNPDSVLFPTYEKTFEYLKKKRGAEVVESIRDENAGKFKHISDTIRGFYEYCREKTYSARLWKRDPQLDLFQGNNSGCCIGIGCEDSFPCPTLRVPGVDYKKYPAGILEFLIDKGIQVMEISEESRGVIGQCWLFLTMNEMGRPDLVVDSFELNSEFAQSRPQQRAVRACAFRFLRNYAKICGADRVLLSVNGQMRLDGTRRPVRNDVDMCDLPKTPLPRPIEKIGGYFLNRPYFLESRLGDTAAIVTAASAGAK